jgi:hypothetical protein
MVTLMREGKFVKIIAPGGATLNFVGVTGTTEKVLMEVSAVARLCDRGCQVFEIKEEAAAEEGKEPKVTYTPLYNNFDLKSGVEIFTEKQKADFEKRGFKECNEDNGGNRQIDSKELEDILVTDIESIIETLKHNEETERIEIISEKLKKHIAELNAQEEVETEPKTEEKIVEEKASARFKKHFKDLEEEEKAKEAEAAKSEEEKAKESALDKGIVYRQLPRFGNKPSSSSFRYNEEGGIEEDTSDKSGANPKSNSDTGVTPAGSDEHTTSPSTTERTETGEATHEDTPGNPETTGSTTTGKPGKKKNGSQAPDEATSPGRRAEENPTPAVPGPIQPPPQPEDHL